MMAVPFSKCVNKNGPVHLSVSSFSSLFLHSLSGSTFGDLQMRERTLAFELTLKVSSLYVKDDREICDSVSPGVERPAVSRQVQEDTDLEEPSLTLGEPGT